MILAIVTYEDGSTLHVTDKDIKDIGSLINLNAQKQLVFEYIATMNDFSSTSIKNIFYSPLL